MSIILSSMQPVFAVLYFVFQLVGGKILYCVCTVVVPNLLTPFDSLQNPKTQRIRIINLHIYLIISHM